MKKVTGILMLLAILLLAAPASAGNAALVVDDDGADCPDAGYTTITAALTDASDGDVIKVCSGEYAGEFVDKSVAIVGAGQVTINSGPLHPAGLTQGFRLKAGSDGSEFSHLTFEVDLAIINGEAASGVSVHHNTFLSAIQAVSNWGGSGWRISHNKIVDLRTRCGGGIGILIGEYTGGTVQGNVVSRNEIDGTLQVAPGDCGGYSGTGIVVYADFRFGRSGATAITGNSIVQNHVSLVSDTPSVVDVIAFELTDTRDDPSADSFPVLFDNAIGFNDWRGTENQILITPGELADHNDISRNFGDKRGQGLHPSVFDPGGN